MQMSIQIPCSQVEQRLWIGMPDLAVALCQQIREGVDRNWWTGLHEMEIGKPELSGPAGGDQNDRCSISLDLVQYPKNSKGGKA